MTIAELLKAYEEKYLPVIIDQARSRSCIRNLLTVLSGQVSNLTHQSLLEYRQARRAQHLSDASVNKELAVLGSAIKWGNKAGLLSFSIVVPRVRETPRATAINETQVQKLIDAAKNLETKAFIALLFATGQRKTAVQRLKRSQIINGVIEFEKDGNEKAARRKRRAATPVTKELSRILKALRAAFGETEYVIPGRNGSGYCGQLDRWFAEAAQEAGVKATPHVIRHSSCSVALARGASLQEASRLLGHSSIKVTEQVYAHFQPGYIADTVSILGGSIKL